MRGPVLGEGVRPDRLDDIRSKKNHWVVLAWAIQNNGPMSLDALSSTLQNFKKIDNRRRRLAQIMTMNKRRGFYVLDSYHAKDETYVSIWAFEGELPTIRESIQRKWHANISP